MSEVSTEQPVEDAEPVELVSTFRAATICGVSVATIRRFVQRGTLKPVAIAPGGPNGTFLYRRDHVEVIAATITKAQTPRKGRTTGRRTRREARRAKAHPTT